MDEFGFYNGVFYDSALESALKECKTDEEREDVVHRYLLLKVKEAIIGIFVIIVLMGITVVIAIFCH